MSERVLPLRTILERDHLGRIVRSTGGRRVGETTRPETRVARAFAQLRSDPATARYLDEYLATSGLVAAAAGVIESKLQEGNIETALNVMSMATSASVTNEARLYAAQRIMEQTAAGEISLLHATEALTAFKPRGGERIASRMKRLRTRIHALVPQNPLD